jgi:hypothetical protein
VSVQLKDSPQQSTPGLTPELCQLINADVDVRRAASLDNVCDSSDIDTDEQLQVRPPAGLCPKLLLRQNKSGLRMVIHPALAWLNIPHPTYPRKIRTPPEKAAKRFCF